MNTSPSPYWPSSRSMQTRRRRPSLLNGASIAVCLLALARSADAVDGTWTSPATGLWSDSLNWLGGTVANGFDATANFDTIDIPGDVAVHLDTARTIGNLIFGDVDVATTPGDWLLDNNGNAANILTLQATGTPTITVNALGDGKSVTIQAEIAGLNGINKAGVGTLTLTGANSYTGGTTLSGGILAFSALNNLGSGGITFDGGTLQWAGTNTTDVSTRTVTVGSGGGTLDVVANNVTLANAIGNNGAGSLTKTGAGTLTLNGVNTYSGGTLLNAGILLVSADPALGAAAGGVTFSGTSTLRFGGAFTLPATRTITSNAGVTGTLDIQANAVTVAGPLAGAGAFTKIGSGVLTYTGTTASGFTGALNINTGIFRVAAGSTLAAGSFTVAATAGAQFHVNGGAFTSSALSTVNQTGAGFLVDAGSAAFNGGIRTNGDNGGVIRVSGGTFTASEVNVQRNSAAAVDFTRGFILSGGTSTVGTIRLGSSNSNGAMSVEGGNLTASGAVTIGNQQTSGRGGAMRVTSGTFTSTDTVDGIVLGKTNLVNGNANNVASATFTGGVSKVEKFTLGFDSTVTAGSSTIAVNGGTLYLGSGGIVKNGTSGLTTAVNLTAGLIGANADWASAVSVSTGTTATNNITIKAASDADVAHDITINGVTGSGGFTKTGGGKLIIGGNSTYNGGSVGTTISAGTLQVGSGGTAGTLGTSVVINNGILAFNRTDALAFANNISGTGALEHNGTGTTTLSGTNTYAGNTTINGGTLRVASSLPSPVVTVNSTGTLGGTGALAGAVTVNSGGRLAPSDAAGTAPATLTLGSLTLSSGSTLDVDFTSVSTFDKVAVTGTNGLTINGVGINLYTSNTVTPWTTTGSYNLFQYNGNLGGLAATNLSSALTVLNPLGSLTYNFSSAGGFITLAIDTVGVTPTWIATGGGSWNTAGNWNTTAPNAQDATAKFGSAISAPSTVTLDGNKTVGVIEFGNTNAYTIAQGTSGTLILSKSSGSAAVDNVSGSHTISAPVSLASPTIVTVFDPADTLTVSGAVSGANSLTKSGLGTLALPSANSFGGGATLTAGTLRIGHNQSLGTAAATVTGNGTLQFGVNNLAPANDVVVNSGATATIDTQSNSATLAGVVSGDGALNKAGSGRLVLLSSANSYNGPTTITAGILSVDNLPDGSFPSPIGQSANDAANLVLNGGTLEYTGTGIFTDRLFHLGTAGGGLAASGTGPVQFINFGAITFAGSNTARTLTLSGTNTDANTLSAVIGNNGTGATSLTKSGAGTWNLGGTNTFSGETVISGGTLVLDNPSALGGSTLNYNNQGGVLDFGFQFQVNLGGLTGGQNLPLTNSPSLNIGGNGQSTTYSGSLTGAASLTKAGAGTLTLTGSNELLGNATISGGTLEVGAGGTLVTPTIAFTATSTLFHQTGGTVTADFLNLENGSAQQLRAAFDAGTATFNTTRLGATNATSAPCVLTINGGTIALGNYSSQRDGSANFNTTAGLIIHGGTVTATSVQVSTNNSWSNLTLTAGSLEIGTSASDGAFFLGGGTNNARGGNLNMSGGTLTYQGIDGLVLNRSAGSSIGQATFSGGTANLSGITLNAATATGGSSTLNITGGTVYLGPGGLQANTVGGATATATLNGGILGASDDWTGNANLTLGANGATFQAADEANIAHDITLSGQLSGSGSVTKTGLGTLTLNGQNTYAGATVVDAGTLVLGQSLTTSSLSIAEGATVQLAAAASPAEAVEATATFDWTDNGNPMQQIIAAGGVAVVPEPGALSLLMIGALAWLSRRC